MLRRPVPYVVLCCAVLFLSAFGLQGGTVGIQLDVAGILTRITYGSASLIGGALLWLGKKGLDSLNRLEMQVAQIERQLTTLSHELFGASGNNGMRSEFKQTQQTVQRHERLLGVLADRAHIPHKEDE